ncbi:hypothetical protein F503_05199 [Ophiostoma piceae UAMH 11346]|uniref:Uncharacterized protein n=1 Tax=Ophiostoma piceae (strain UAMH 11346) TaxID=1262450 RepID=S3C9C3_OPHP1|nr:hypothetical protein F503_05199 [Ophiostoma piceae UAMH 11346]
MPATERNTSIRLDALGGGSVRAETIGERRLDSTASNSGGNGKFRVFTMGYIETVVPYSASSQEQSAESPGRAIERQLHRKPLRSNEAAAAGLQTDDKLANESEQAARRTQKARDHSPQQTSRAGTRRMATRDE